MVHAPSPLSAGTPRIEPTATLAPASRCAIELYNPINQCRVKGPAAIISISTRAPGELKLLMQMVVLAGRHSPK